MLFARRPTRTCRARLPSVPAQVHELIFHVAQLLLHMLPPLKNCKRMGDQTSWTCAPAVGCCGAAAEEAVLTRGSRRGRAEELRAYGRACREGLGHVDPVELVIVRRDLRQEAPDRRSSERR